MRIALDYDGTYTDDPLAWDNVVATMTMRGHRVLIVTMRRPDEPIVAPPLCEVVYTSRRAKVAYCREQGLGITHWIDDSPHWLLEDAA